MEGKFLNTLINELQAGIIKVQRTPTFLGDAVEGAQGIVMLQNVLRVLKQTASELEKPLKETLVGD